jgi:endo-1,4-beta-D-glucanase Y
MKIIFTFFISFFAFAIFAQTPAYPFPHHVAYTAGTIKPSAFTQKQLDDKVANYYDAWKATYLLSSCGGGTYFVLDNDLGGGTNKNDDCVSEGQGYGMVIVPLMAGHDPDAQTIFDGLFKFFKQHLSDIDTSLMCWVETLNCESDTSQGPDAATDGDMNIAYGLLLADMQWGSSGTINYKAEALKILKGLRESETNTTLHILILGDWVKHDAKYVNSTRPSDFMYDEMRAYASAVGNAYWTDVLNECYSIVNTFDTGASINSGLFPDFVINCNTTPAAAPANFLETKDDGHYSYNSCRTPWHLATDYLLFGDSRAKNALSKINDFMLNSTGGDVNKMHSGYKLDGTPLAGSNYQDECFLGPFTVAATESSKYQSWLDACYAALIAKGVAKNHGYYNNTLKLLDLIAIAGDYWTPLKTTLAETENVLPTDNIRTVSVYPNPCKENLSVNYNADDAGTLHINIVNMNGALVYQNNKTVTAGENTFSINLNKMTEGVYILALDENMKREKISFVVSK